MFSEFYTRPVDVIDGQYDSFFCGGDCYAGVPAGKGKDQAAAFIPQYYPKADKAKSRSFIVPGSGHLINAHLRAKDGWVHQVEFLKGCGF